MNGGDRKVRFGVAGLLGPDVEELIRSAPTEVAEATEGMHPADLAEIAEDLEAADRAVLLNHLPVERVAELVGYLERTLVAETLASLEPGRAALVLRGMSSDERADTVARLDRQTAESFLARLSRADREETRRLLAKDGVLAANTFTISRLYHHESVTFEAVFGRFVNFRLPLSANRIVFAVNGALPSEDVMRERAAKWAPLLAPYGVPIATYPDKLTTDRDWNTAVRPLTDQYSPANLLREKD